MAAIATRMTSSAVTKGSIEREGTRKRLLRYPVCSEAQTHRRYDVIELLPERARAEGRRRRASRGTLLRFLSRLNNSHSLFSQTGPVFFPSPYDANSTPRTFFTRLFAYASQRNFTLFRHSDKDTTPESSSTAGGTRRRSREKKEGAVECTSWRREGPTDCGGSSKRR
jgi:hypothetical protein